MTYDPLASSVFAVLAGYFVVRLTWVVAQRSRGAVKQRLKDQY